jgi:hypothetical protein
MFIEQLKAVATALEEEPSLKEVMTEMINLMEKIQQTPVVKKEEGIRFMDLSCQANARLQNKVLEVQQQTINYCTGFRAQVEKVIKANGELTLILFQQPAFPCHPEANA